MKPKARHAIMDGEMCGVLAQIGIEGVNSNPAAAIRTFVVLFMPWGMVFLTNAQKELSPISRKGWIFLILSGMAAGALWL